MQIHIIFNIFIVALIFINGSDANCAFTQYCKRQEGSSWTVCPSANDIELGKKLDPPALPRKNNSTMLSLVEEICPEFADKEVCCNDDQIVMLSIFVFLKL